MDENKSKVGAKDREETDGQYNTTETAEINAETVNRTNETTEAKLTGKKIIVKSNKKVKKIKYL